MHYGLIGEHLGHSFSKAIHERIAPYTYETCELAPSELDSFMCARSFRAINVTIPYKEKAMQYLDGGMDASARRVGAVNVVVNRDGKLYGANTDYEGFKALASHAGIEFKGRKVLILGMGGAGKAVAAVVRDAGAASVLFAVRHQFADDQVLYDDLRNGCDAQVVVNATPVGMYPDNDGCPVELSCFHRLEGVLDCVANPLRTRLVMDALQRSIRAEGGLYMLVAQAVYSSELFLGTHCENVSRTIDDIYEWLLRRKTNIVLTGMPSCGKSTFGAMLAGRLGMPLVDTDTMAVAKAGMSVADYALKFGEAAFRQLESEVVAEIAAGQGRIIATGGGVPMNADSVRRLKQNGFIVFIDRPLDKLEPSLDRPFSNNKESLERRFKERYQTYIDTADSIVRNDDSKDKAMEELMKIAAE